MKKATNLGIADKQTIRNSRKTKNLFRRAAGVLLLALGMTTTSWAQNSPTGNLEYVSGLHGSIHVKGWTEDPDNIDSRLTVAVYVKDNNNQPVEGYDPVYLTADQLRNGEDNQLHYNGYEDYLFIATAGTYKVDVMHVDATGDGSPMYTGINVQVSDPYTVTYNANGGSGAPAQQLKGENVDLTLTTAHPTWGSNGFLCWNTSSNGGGTTYQSGGTYSGNSNVTLYAMWSASFIPGNGTQSDPYLITNTEQWNLFANNVNNGNTYNGKWVKLGADITVSTMAGKTTYPRTSFGSFQGTFDGGGHTLNLAIDATNAYTVLSSNNSNIAPFRSVDGATFIDLNLTGYVRINEFPGFSVALGGLVGEVMEGCNVRILNCRSSVNVTLTSNDNYGNMGGFIGTNAGTVVMDNCLFDGTLSGRPEYVGGIVGRQTPGTMTISNCLMNGSGSGLYGTDVAVKCTFGEVPSIAQHLTMTNCYYTTAIGTTQGEQTSNSGETLRAQLGSGWIVNGSGQVVPGPVTRYTITVDENIAHGTIVSSDAQSLPGATITLTAIPDQGYYGASVTYSLTPDPSPEGEGSATTLSLDYNTCTFTMPAANVTVTGTMNQSTYYTVSYNLDGGSLTPDPSPSGEGSGNPTIYTAQSSSFTLVNPTRDGYTFAGWTGTGINGTSLNVTVPHGSTGNRSYTATWAIHCTITYNLNNGTLPAPNPTVYSAMSDDITLVAPIRSGYIFAGWTGTGLSQPTVNVVIPHGSTGDRTYTATWTSASYTISYNLGGGSVNPSNPTSYTFTTPDFTLVNPTRSGYTFAGWVGTGIDGQAMTVTIPLGSVGNRSYTAVWALNGNTAYQAYNTNTDQFETRYANNPTTVGTGTSWGSNNSETWYIVNSDVTVDEEINVNGTVNLILCNGKTLTANNGINVTSGKTLNIYSQNGGESGIINANISRGDHAGIGGGSVGTISIHGGTITAKGSSWSAGIGGGTNGGGGTIAIYGGNVYGASVGTNPGNACGIGHGSSGGDVNIIFPDGTQTGYGSSARWLDYNVRYSQMGDRYMRVRTCNNHNYQNGRCKYCNKRQNFTVTYNANNATGGSVPTDATQYSNAGTGTATVLGNSGNLQRTGFVFARWNTKADGSGTSYSAGQTFTIYHDITLYAYWAEVYPITYDLAGGSMPTANPTGYHLFSSDITLNNPTREGYTFVGWTGSNGNTPQLTATIPSGSVGARTYTANWAPIVHLAVNADNTQAIAQSSTQPFTTIVLDGYTFRRDSSWNTLCLPFNLVSFTETPLEGATVKSLATSSVTGNTLTATFADVTSIQAGKPYIVKWRDAVSYDDADFVIHSAADWNTFASNVNNGTDSYQGKIVKLAADINVTTMVGTGSGESQTNPFRGTFDGCGHTLTFTISASEDLVAPFRYVNGATIQNLVVAGSNTSSARENAGLVGCSGGTVTISNCEVGATITNNAGYTNFGTGNSACGGFVGVVVSGTITFNNCLFSGKMLGSATCMGGFVGWMSDFPTVLNNCLFDPSQLKSADDERTFARGGDGAMHFNNCYYRTSFGTAQGTYTSNTGSALQAQLGDGWVVKNGNVIPKMVTAIDNIVDPMFINVVVSTTNNNSTTTYADFVGSYAPFSVGNLLPDTANMVRNAFHGVLSIHDVVPPTGYLIGNWYTDQALTTPATAIPFAASGEVTLFALYTPITYTVAFDANGGTGTMASQSFTYDAAQNLTANAFSRTGYLFAGWSLTSLTPGPSPSGEGSEYHFADGQSVSNLASEDGATVILYAQWTPITYTVHFNKNHDDASGTMTDQTLTYDAPESLTANAFVRTNFGFIGWSTTAGGSVVYSDGESVLNLADGQDDEVTLYAQWSEAYTLSYDLAGGSVATPNPATYTEYTPTITLVNPTRTGYTFTGWTGTDLSEATMTVTIPTGSTGNRSYTATWTPLIYTISYDLAGGSLLADNPSTYTIESEGITLVNPTLAGYTFAGWTGTDLTEATITVTIPTGSYGDRSLVATWAENTLTLAADADNNATITAVNGLVYDVTLGGYTLHHDGSWNTITLPFDLDDLTGTPLEGATVKTLANSTYSDGTLTMSMTNNLTSIEAGKPYIAKWNADLIIHNATEWNNFATSVNNGTTYAGKIVKLSADISINTMVGNSSSHAFKGTFDGCGHTITVNLSGVGTYGAPFQNLDGATIRNLHVAGSISGTDILEGIAGRTYGNTRIENCHSSVSLTSTNGHNAAMAGIAGLAENGSLIVTNCLFDGSLLGSNNTNCAGIVNWSRNSSSINISNCLFAPAQVTVSTTGAYTITNPTSASVTNCYYTQALGTAQGNYVGSMTPTELVAALGSGWKVSGNSVVPIMINLVNELENPVFNDVTINSTTQQLNNSTTYADFVGSYAPFSGSELLDAHNPDGDAMHASLAIIQPTDPPTGYTGFSYWCSDQARENAATAIPFSSDGSVTLYAKWVPIDYTITYNLDGGNVATSNPTTYTIDSDPITLAIPTRDGYAFAGWTGTDLTETTVYVTIPTGSTGDRTYTAHWQDAINYLAYNTTSHLFETLATTIAYSNVSSSSTTMAGGWYAVTGNTTIGSRINVTGTVNLILCDGATLTAPKGMHVPAGVTLNIYGQTLGTGALTISNVDQSQAAIGGNYGNGNHEDGGTVTIHGGVITAISTFDAAGIGGSDYGGNGGTVTIYGGTVTATGKRSAAGIGGGYNGNGGTVTITGGTVTATGGPEGGAGIGGGKYKAGGSVTITGGTITAIAGNGSAQAIGRGQSSMSSGSIQLAGEMKVFASADTTEPVVLDNRIIACHSAYARIEPCTEHNWVNNTCSWCGATCGGVAYGRNHATDGTAPVDNNDYTLGQTVTVLGNSGNLERTGYTFDGWNTAADGTGTNYTAGATFAFSGLVTLYAKWAPVTYTITFVDWDGTVLSEQQVDYGEWPDLNVFDIPFRQADAQYTYIFSGWSPDVEPVTGNTIYTAQYDAVVNTYTIVFKDEDGSELQSSELAYGTMPSYTGETPTKDDDDEYYSYNFAGWVPSITTVTGDATYTAHFTRDYREYTITYNGVDSASFASPNPTTYTAASGDITLAGPTREGYTFAGWTGTDLANPTMTVTIPTGSIGNRSYTATWTPIEYTITFVDWDGTVLSEQQVDYGEWPDLNVVDIPFRQADAQYTYTFAGWSPSVGPVTGNTIYTAQYDATVNQYTIEFYNEDGTLLQSSDFDYGSMPVYSGATPTKEDEHYTYTFEGWTPEITTVTGSATYTVYFSRTVINYTITYNGMEGATLASPNPTSYNYEGGDITLVNPTKAGYTFIGWTGSNGDSPQTTVVIPWGISGDLEYTANWELITEVDYVAYNSSSQEFENLTTTSFTPIAASTTSMGSANTETWYALQNSVTMNGRIEIAGTVHLVLCDGMTLAAPKGIHVPPGATLNIYGQSEGTGSLDALFNVLLDELMSNQSYINMAAIGGNDREACGDIAIHGGHVTASGVITVSTPWGTMNVGAGSGIGGGRQSGMGGSLAIHGGTVTATGGATNGAGIGGGQSGHGVDIIVITGGTVTATGQEGAAGIGGGKYQDDAGGNGGTSITISGGSVTANGGSNASGIGGGHGGNGYSNVIISGGTVIAIGINKAAGIGGGEKYGVGGTGGTSVTISGGQVTAIGGNNGGAGIGGSQFGDGYASVSITGGTVHATSSTGQAIGRGYHDFYPGSNVPQQGTLTLGVIGVFASESAVYPVALESRDSVCRSTYARIEPCTEHNWFDNTCAWCGATNHGVAYSRNHATSGTVPIDANEYLPNATVTVPGNTGNLERASYTYSGWNTAADGNGTDLSEGSTFTYNGPVTIYAKWIPITYYVRFNKNHDDATGTMTNQLMTYDVAQPLAANAFVRTGYSLAGWSTTADGTVAYGDGQSVVNLASEQDAVADLYAQWTENYSISYNLDGGSVATPNPTIYTAISPDITLNNPTRDDYFFTGWTGSNGDTPQRNVTIAHGTTGDLTYTANWIPLVANVPYQAYNTATDQFESLTAPTAIPLDALTVPMGSTGTESWYVLNSDATIDSRIIANGTVNIILCDGATLTAPKGINVGSVATLNIYGQTNGTGTIGIAGCDYGYAGIGGDNSLAGRDCGNIAIHGGTISAMGGNFGAGIGGGQSGDGGEYIHIYGGNVTATMKIIEGDGVFNATGIGGGNLGAGFASVVIKGGVVVAMGDGSAMAIGGSRGKDNGTIEPFDDMRVYASAETTEPVAYTDRESTCRTFYARIEPCTEHHYENDICTWCGGECNSITYDGNNATSGTVPMDDACYQSGQTATVLDNNGNLALTGYSFAGWNTQADGSGTDYAAGDALTVTSSVTLYAQWQLIPLNDVPYLAYNTTTGAFDACTASVAMPVTSATTTMSNGWYAVNSNVTISDIINVTGTVNLILCDGATLTATRNITMASGATLNIYGQAGGTGTLTLNSREMSAILGNNGNIAIHGGNITILNSGTQGMGIEAYRTNVAIYGGNIDINRCSMGIYAYQGGNVTINGGHVSINPNFSFFDGIFVSQGSITISGGNVNSSSLRANGNITLGWSSPDDRIYSSSYYVNSGTLSVRSGQSFWNGTEAVSGTVTDLGKVNGLTLIPNTTTDVTPATSVWQVISTPTHDNGQTYESIANVTNLTTGSYDMFRYDEASATWENQKASAGTAAGFSTMEPARGYIYRRSTATTLTFNGMPNSEANYSIALTASGSGNLQGFNLVGNPYPYKVLVDRAFYSLGADGSWTAHLQGDSVAVGQGILVHTTAGETLTFYAATRSTNPGSKGYLPPLPSQFEDLISESRVDDNINSELRSPNSALFAYQDGDHIVIDATMVSLPTNLRVYDIMGRLLLNFEIQNLKSEIQNSAFPSSGVYLLRLGKKSQKIVIVNGE